VRRGRDGAARVWGSEEAAIEGQVDGWGGWRCRAERSCGGRQTTWRPLRAGIGLLATHDPDILRGTERHARAGSAGEPGFGDDVINIELADGIVAIEAHLQHRNSTRGGSEVAIPARHQQAPGAIHIEFDAALAGIVRPHGVDCEGIPGARRDCAQIHHIKLGLVGVIGSTAHTAVVSPAEEDGPLAVASAIAPGLRAILKQFKHRAIAASVVMKAELGTVALAHRGAAQERHAGVLGGQRHRGAVARGARGWDTFLIAATAGNAHEAIGVFREDLGWYFHGRRIPPQQAIFKGIVHVGLGLGGG
jgi:hypothetical protein